MTALRFFLIIVVFIGASLAWLVLGGTVEYRTASLSGTLGRQVDALWGPANLSQSAPCLVSGAESTNPTDPLASNITVHIGHENRYKGLLWFSTYTVEFAGAYTVRVPTAQPAAGKFVFPLPRGVPFIENLRLTLDDKPLDVDAKHLDNTLQVEIPPDNQPHTVAVTYRTRGRDQWLYLVGDFGDEPSRSYRSAPDDSASDRQVHLRNFTLTATTNFEAINYPQGTLSPTTKAEPFDGGVKTVWKIGDSRLRQRIGIETPGRRDAGPITARMAFFAPVTLFFFFTVLFTTMLLKKAPLHPMHYLLISAGFFAFHILLAYLVDKMDIHYAFWICAATSLFLVVSYMRLVAGAKFAVLYVGCAQLVYLIGFSYAFFWTGYTGLTIVIIAIVTLFVLMQATGRVDWNEAFRKPLPDKEASGWTSVEPRDRGKAT